MNSEHTLTTAEHTEPAIKWAQSLLHHAAFPDPVSMYCAIPAQSVEAAARYLASVERENEDARATIARLEGGKDTEAERITLSVCAALGIDPNLADGDGSDPVSWIVSAVQQHYEVQQQRADAAERRVEAVPKVTTLPGWYNVFGEGTVGDYLTEGEARADASASAIHTVTYTAVRLAVVEDAS